MYVEDASIGMDDDPFLFPIRHEILDASSLLQ